MRWRSLVPGVRVALALVLGATFAAVPALAQQGQASGRVAIAELGAELSTVTPEIAERRRLPLPFGVLVEQVMAGGAAAKAGIAIGDLIQAIDNKPVLKAEDAAALLAPLKTGTQVRMRIARGDQLLALAATLAAPPAAVVLPSAGEPVLMLDTGGHMSLVRQLFFAHDGRRLISGGDDKVIRVWDWANHRIERTIRGEVAPGSEGKIFSLALSPRETEIPSGHRWLAAGGWLKVAGKPGHKIRLFDYASGKLVRLLEGHEDVVNNLAFSPGGSLLLSGSADRHAIIWEVSTGKIHLRLRGHTERVNAVAFTSDGLRVVTGSDDRSLKLWEVESGRLINTMTGHADNIASIAVNPRDGTIASIGDDAEIRLWDGSTGRPLKTFVKLGDAAGFLAFSHDGKRLISELGQVSRRFPVRVLDASTGKEIQRFGSHTDVVLAAALSSDNRTVATGGGERREIHVWDLETGQPLRLAGDKPVTLVGNGTSKYAAGFSKDGQSIAWGSSDAGSTNSRREAYEFHLRLPTDSDRIGQPRAISPADAARPDAWLRAVTRLGATELAHHPSTGIHARPEGILEISRAGEALARISRDTTTGFRHRSYSLAPSGQLVVSGGANGVLTAYGLDGKKLGDFVGHEGDVWAVTPSPDGRLLISGSADQTVRLWNLATRELIVTLFHGTDGEWVMWTPQGFYTGSARAEQIVGWNLNRGPDKEAHWVTAEQLRRHLYRPDVVEKAIVRASATEAIRELGITQTAADVLRRPLPLIRTIWPLGGMSLSGGKGVITAAIKRGPAPPTEWRISVGTFEQNPQAERSITPRPVTLPAGHPAIEPDEDLFAFEVPLRRGTNLVKITAENANGPSATITHGMFHPGPGDLDERGTLRILAVGVDLYPGAQPSLPNLSFAGQDARAFARAAADAWRARHTGEPRVETLCRQADCTAPPTRANILAALDRLAAAGDRDTTVLFMAGHGEAEGQRYYFLPTDVERSDIDRRITTNTLGWDLVEAALARAKGTKLLFVDACRSATAFHDRLLNNAARLDVVAFSSAGPNQIAWEHPDRGHGLFTYWLIKGLKGEAADTRTRAITVSSLWQYLAANVATDAARLRLSQQEPIVTTGSNSVILQR